MGKKADAKKTGKKIPKRIAGVKVPKHLRESAEALIARATSPEGRRAIGSGIAMFAAAASAAKARAADGKSGCGEASRSGEGQSGEGSAAHGGVQTDRIHDAINAAADAIAAKLGVRMPPRG